MLIISKYIVTDRLAVSTLLLVLALSCSLFSCNSYKSEFVEIKPIATHFNGMEYIGMQSCVECHLDIVESHKKTSHYKTSFKTAAIAFDKILKTQPNEINLKDGTKIVINKEGNKLFQDFRVFW